MLVSLWVGLPLTVLPMMPTSRSTTNVCLGPVLGSSSTTRRTLADAGEKTRAMLAAGDCSATTMHRREELIVPPSPEQAIDGLVERVGTRMGAPRR